MKENSFLRVNVKLGKNFAKVSFWRNNTMFHENASRSLYQLKKILRTISNSKLCEYVLE